MEGEKYVYGRRMRHRFLSPPYFGPPPFHRDGVVIDETGKKEMRGLEEGLRGE